VLLGIVPSDGVKGSFGALSSRCMIACMHAMLHIAMSVLGLGGGTIERFLGLSVRIKPHALTVPCDLFPSWASGAADEDAGEKAK
jgi:uncharacterized ferritin-like protein (DUF455 family)